MRNQLAAEQHPRRSRLPTDPLTQQRSHLPRMPPQQGLFAVPLGASASLSQAGITSGPSSAATQLGTIPPVGPGMGLALVGGSSKNSRLDSQHSIFDQRDGSSTGARAGVIKGSGEAYGQGHQQQQQLSYSNSHNHHSSHNAGPGPSTRNTMEDGRKEKKRKESSRTGKDTGDRRDECVFSSSFVAVFLFSLHNAISLSSFLRHCYNPSCITLTNPFLAALVITLKASTHYTPQRTSSQRAQRHMNCTACDYTHSPSSDPPFLRSMSLKSGIQ